MPPADMFLLFTLVGTLAAVGGYAAAAVVSLLFFLRKPRYGPGAVAFQPPVTVVIPLRGANAGLEEVLTALATLDYPEYQLLIGAEDADDAGLAIARRVAARFPDRDLTIVAPCPVRAAHPAVGVVQHLMRWVRHDFVLRVWDGVQLDPAFLRRNLPSLHDGRVGLCFPTPVAIGEETSGAALDNHTLTMIVGVHSTFAGLVSGQPVVTGKCLLLRRAALEQVGGFRAVANLHNEDFILARRIKQAGWRVVSLPETVTCIQRRLSIRGYLARQFRWATGRARTGGPVYVIEPFANPLAVALWTATAAALLDIRWGLLLMAGTILTKTIVDVVTHRVLAGRYPRWRDLPLLPLKDLALYGVWLAALGTRQITWRDRTMYMVGPRLVRPEVYRRWIGTRERLTR